MLWFLIAIGIPVLGLALLIWGVRGKRVDDHPVCRGCRFDLVGHEPSPETCPECGRALTGNRAIRTGNRKRRWAAIAGGSFVLLVMLTIGGALIWAGRTNFDWNTVKPTWLLVFETGGADAGRVSAALDEIIRRYKARDLTTARRDDLIDLALAKQADHEHLWNSTWGNLIEAVYLGGDLPVQDWEQYARNSISGDLRPRSPVRQGDVVMPQVRITMRTAKGTILDIHWMADRIELGEKVAESQFFMPLSEFGTNVLIADALRPPLKSIPIDSGMIIAGMQGTQPLRVVSRMVLNESGLQVLEWSDVFEAEIEVVSSDSPIFELSFDEQTRDAIHQAVRPKVRGNKLAADGRHVVYVQFTVGDLPIPIACQLVVLAGGNEYPSDYYYFNDRSGSGFPVVPRDDAESEVFLESGIAETVDLILRPNVDLVTRTRDTWRIWGEEIVFEGVPVEWID